MFIAEKLDAERIHLSTSKCKLPTVKSTVMDPTVISRLQARYLRYLSTDWPHCYVQLALVKGEKMTSPDDKIIEITRLTLHGKVDEILLRKEQLSELSDIFHYQNKPCPRLIIITGGPGIDFDVVILIPLKFVQQKSIEEEMIEHIGKEAYEHMKKSAGSRCLVILEGLDEMPAECRWNDTFLVRIMKCTLLEKGTILITSRPHACETLDVDRIIEVVGFGKEEIRGFVEVF
ncbi:uncharacterized protein [Dysidea avara]|uniref:uncharacterized protein n=1 Tax=Dysidea avara TaxID=196820 RepID=UPI00331FE21C